MPSRKLKKSFNAAPSQQEVNDFVAAAYDGKPDGIAAFLDKHHIAIDAVDHRGGTALGEAVRRRRQEIVELLLVRGADIDKRDGGGVTPLMHAAYSGDVGIVRLLLEKGADTNEEYNDGISPVLTPLKVAEELYNAKIVEMLKQRAQEHKAREEERRARELAEQKARFLEDTDFSRGLKKPIPVHRPFKVPPRAH